MLPHLTPAVTRPEAVSWDRPMHSLQSCHVCQWSHQDKLSSDPHITAETTATGGQVISAHCDGTLMAQNPPVTSTEPVTPSSCPHMIAPVTHTKHCINLLLSICGKHVITGNSYASLNMSKPSEEACPGIMSVWLMSNCF